MIKIIEMKKHTRFNLNPISKRKVCSNSCHLSCSVSIKFNDSKHCSTFLRFCSSGYYYLLLHYSYDLFENFTCMTDSMSFKKICFFFFVPLLFDDVILVKPESELFCRSTLFVKKRRNAFEVVINLNIFETVTTLRIA